MKKNLFRNIVGSIVAMSVFASCNKMFDLKPQDQLDISQMYRNVYDADAAIVGLYGKFQKLAEQYIVLNELRGDMIDYTQNADKNLQEISTHSVSTGNPYANPRPFYELILNCNDVLQNFDIMKRDNKIKDAEYQQRYADVGFLRSFLFLQMGIHFGTVPYVTKPLNSVDDIKTNTSQYYRIPFNDLLDSLIKFCEAVPFKDEYPSGTNLNITVDGQPTAKWFVNKKFLLGDLHLWRGNYTQAATYYRQVMETGTTGTQGGSYYSMYKLGWDSNGDIDHYISYSRNGDASTLITNTQWRVMFEQAPTTEGFRREWVWVLPFDSKFLPENPMVKLFSPIGGSYLLKPSQEAIDNWNAQKQKPLGSAPTTPGQPYDARGQLSWRNINGQPVVMKYLYNYLNYTNNLPINILQKNGKWFLYRQTHLHLRFSEAANRDRKHRLAWGFLNSGIAGAFPAPTSDVTLYHNTLWEPYPYNFDARNSGSSGVPYYRADWYRNIGIRSRANLIDVSPIVATDSLLTIENALINETALENGFEGTRWADLLRIALRRNDPAYLADKVYNKLLKDGVPNAAAVRTKLMDKNNWYLPFNF